MFQIKRFAASVVLSLAAFSVGALAQKATPTPSPAVTVLPTAPAAGQPPMFVAEAEKFSIGLPKPNSFKAIKTGEMFGVAAGMQYTWGMKEGTITVALALFDEPMRREADFLDFAEGMKQSSLQAYKGTLVSERIDKTGKFRLIETYFTAADGRLMLFRWYVSNNEYYNIQTVLKKDHVAEKDTVIGIMDSFKILDAPPAAND